MKRVIVFSLGGSLIVQDEVDVSYLQKLKQVLTKNAKKHNCKFILVCGGGKTARTYINALKKSGSSEQLQSYIGISITRTNARLLSYFFNQDPDYGVPHTHETLKKYLEKEDIVFCGALEYKPHQTSDSTAAQLAEHFKTIFINLTNVSGLYTKNPLEHKDAKFIPKISWKDLYTRTHKMKYSPGQHFVIDQRATEIIMKHKVKTYILGKDLKQLDNLLNNKPFRGTTVEG